MNYVDTMETTTIEIMRFKQQRPLSSSLNGEYPRARLENN